MDKINIEKIRNYFDGKPVERVWLFGSYARGTLFPEVEENVMKDKILIYERICS